MMRLRRENSTFSEEKTIADQIYFYIITCHTSLKIVKHKSLAFVFS